MLSIIPVLLLGAKYVLDQQTANKVQLENGEIVYGGATADDVSASDIAVNVAKNWNPGRTLSQQRAAVEKVADKVSESTVGYRLSIVNQAVQGLDIHHWKKVEGKYGIFEPLKIEPGSVSSASLSRIATGKGAYDAVDYYENRYKVLNYNSESTWNPHFALWRAVDVNTSLTSNQDGSEFDELNESKLDAGIYELDHHEMFKNPAIGRTGENSDTYKKYPTNSYYAPTCHEEHAQFLVTTPNLSSSGTNKYSGKTDSYGATETFVSSTKASRKHTQKRSSTDYVSVSVANDKIKIQIDNQSAYAKPAECNVDIVLAIPVNGAASNVNNRDAASDTAETSVNGIVAATPPTTAITGTPIYEMGQACKSFVKQFYHMRGVTMGLIPYSGKVSLSPDKTGYTSAIPAFREPSPSPRMMIGACLYGTSGEKDAPLIQGYKTKSLVTNQTLPTGDTPYYWGGMLTGCPIMSRRGIQSIEKRYGNNYVAKGNLTSISDPTSSADYKYRRMNLAPCYGGYANMLSMRCERACTHYLPNPYYMIEPTADLTKIYEMCNALYPFYDTKNVSNFLFIPLEWTRNFFQSWTNNPSVSASSDQLSRPSKTASGRKKVLILLVNKPDWFEPGEMTYLGFDNDISEIPMVESDKIDFSINYGDSSKKFLDGSSYDGTIAGSKKILRIERVSGSNLVYKTDDKGVGFYEANGTYRLKFPRKGFVKLKVAQPKIETGTVTFYDTNIGSTYDVRKDSTSGSTISLGSAQTVTGSQTFVFSGACLAPSGKAGHQYNCSFGKNFRANLSVKKVKYALSNAVISDCTLKDQVIRFYGGMYYSRRYSNPGEYNGVTTTSPLTLNNGSQDLESNYINGLKSNNVDGTGDYDTYGWYTPKAYISYSKQTVSNPYPLHRDSNISFTTTVTTYANHYPHVCNFSARVYGVKNVYIVPAGSWSRDSLSDHSGSVYTNYIDFRMPSEYWQFYIQNQDPKYLKNTQDTPISNPLSNTNLKNNDGIYLAKDNGQDWICFQGDGELHVTVQEKTNNSKYWYDLKDGGTSSQQTISSTSQTITIPSSAFKEDHGRYVAKVYFRNAFVKSLTQQPGTSTLNTIESTINPSSSYPLVYSYEKPDGSIETKTATSMIYDSTKKKYYVDLSPACLPKYAAIKFSKTEAVDDLIEFYSSTSNKNGRMTASSFSGSNSNYFYTVSSCTGRLTITDPGVVELIVAPKFDGSVGTIKFGSGTTETIDKQKMFKIQSSDMTSSGSSYYFDVTCNNLILIKAKYYYRPDVTFPYDMERTQILDWRNSSMSAELTATGPNISMSGSYNNYNSSDKYHRLNTSSCYPTVKNTAFASDISAVVNVRADSDSQTKMFLYWYMPEYTYGGSSTWFTGTVRLFSPQTRDSDRNFCQIQPYSSTYNNMSNILAHSFTTPYNSVLYLNNYQENWETPTEGAAKATADVCSKLKAEHGSNLRIYAIKYRKQSNYKTFPAGETKSHSYKTIEDCADFKYDVTSKASLESTLKTIADAIKKSDFAGHTEAVEC